MTDTDTGTGTVIVERVVLTDDLDRGTVKTLATLLFGGEGR